MLIKPPLFDFGFWVGALNGLLARITRIVTGVQGERGGGSGYDLVEDPSLRSG
jgi:hypothetical protein